MRSGAASPCGSSGGYRHHRSGRSSRSPPPSGCSCASTSHQRQQAQNSVQCPANSSSTSSSRGASCFRSSSDDTEALDRAAQEAEIFLGDDPPSEFDWVGDLTTNDSGCLFPKTSATEKRHPRKEESSVRSRPPPCPRKCVRFQTSRMKASTPKTSPCPAMNVSGASSVGGIEPRPIQASTPRAGPCSALGASGAPSQTTSRAVPCSALGASGAPSQTTSRGGPCSALGASGASSQTPSRAVPCSALEASGASSQDTYFDHTVSNFKEYPPQRNLLSQSQRDEFRRQLQEIEEYCNMPLSTWQQQQCAETEEERPVRESSIYGMNQSPRRTCPNVSGVAYLPEDTTCPGSSETDPGLWCIPEDSESTPTDSSMCPAMLNKGLEKLSGDDPTVKPQLEMKKCGKQKIPETPKPRKSSLNQRFMKERNGSASKKPPRSPKQPCVPCETSSEEPGPSQQVQAYQRQQSSRMAPALLPTRSPQRVRQAQVADQSSSCLCDDTSSAQTPPCPPDLYGPGLTSEIGVDEEEPIIECPEFPVEKWREMEQDVTELDLELEQQTEDEVRRVRESLGPCADQYEVVEALCAAGIPDTVIEREMERIERECELNRQEQEDLEFFEKVEQMIDEETKDIDIALMLYREEIEARRRRGDIPGVPTLKLPENKKTYTLRRQLRQMHKQVRPYTIVEGEEPEEIQPDVAAALMHTEEKGLHLGDTPEQLFSYLFRTSGSSRVDVMPVVAENQVVPGKMSSIPSESVRMEGARERTPSTDVYSETVGAAPPPEEQAGPSGSQAPQAKTSASSVEELGPGAVDYFLEASPPAYFTRLQLRGSVPPDWFPGFMETMPHLSHGVKLSSSPSEVMKTVWYYASPDTFKPKHMKIASDRLEEGSGDDGQDESEQEESCPCSNGEISTPESKKKVFPRCSKN